MKRSNDGTMEPSTSKNVREELETVDLSRTLDEGFINYMSTPTLERMAMTQVLTVLLAQPDVLEELNYYEKNNILVKQRVVQKFSSLSIPETIRKDIEYLIMPMVNEILRWNDEYPLCSDDFPKINVCWMADGTMDETKIFETAIKICPERIIKKKVLDLYDEACRYCLEDLTKELWDLLSESEKLSKTKKPDFSQMYYYYKDFLRFYWAYPDKEKLKSILHEMNLTESSYAGGQDYDENNDKSVYRRAFDSSVARNNLIGAQYFWNKLTKNERCGIKLEINIKTLLEYFLPDEACHVLLFLLSQIDSKENQIKLLQSYSNDVIKGLVERPHFHRFLLPTLRNIWDRVDGNIFSDLMLNALTKHATISENLFRVVWLETPANLKKCFLQRIYLGAGKAKLILRMDANVILLIFAEMKPKERMKIISTRMTQGSLSIFVRDFASLYKLITAACDGDEAEICLFKNKMIIFLEQASPSIFYDPAGVHYDFFDKFLAWCFSSNEEELKRFKRELASRSNYLMVTKFARGRNKEDWTAFLKFTDWCFLNSDEQFERFKRDISQIDNMEHIISKALTRDNLVFADCLLNFCFGSSGLQEIQYFKNALFMTRELKEMLETKLLRTVEYKDDLISWMSFEKILRWGSPLCRHVTNLVKEHFRWNCLYLDQSSELNAKVSTILDCCTPDNESFNRELYNGSDKYRTTCSDEVRESRTETNGDSFDDDSNTDSDCYNLMSD